MEIFVNRFGLENLKKRGYAKYKPPICFSQVAIIEMSNDPKIKMEEAFTERVAKSLTDKVKEGYNYFASTAPAVWLSAKYREWFGKEATPE